MDPSTTDWTAAENKAFQNALAEVNLNSSDWFEHLITRFPNKTPEQLRDRYLDLIVDIERKESDQFSNLVETNPWTVEATGTKDQLVMDLPYSLGFPKTGSMCSGASTMSILEKKPREVDLLLPVEKLPNAAILSEQTIRESSFSTIARRLMEESSNDVVERVLVPKVQGWAVPLPKITKRRNGFLAQKTDEMKMVEDILMETEMQMELPEMISEVECGKRILRKVTGVTEGKMSAADQGILTPTKGKQWTEEEHRLDPSFNP